MPSRMLNITAPTANGESHSTRLCDRNNGDGDGDGDGELEEVEYEVISNPVQTPASKSKTLTHHLTTSLVNAQFISTTINLFRPTHSSLTSRTFWTTQILLELDSILWRSEYLGREPEDQEMEGLAEECLGGMWANIVDQVKLSRDEWYKRRREDEENELAAQEGCRRAHRRRGSRAMKARVEMRGLEERLEDMKIGIRNGHSDWETPKEKHEDVQEEELGYEAVHNRGNGIRKEGMDGQGSRGRHKKSASYSGCGVTYLYGNVNGTDGKSPVKRGSRPGNAGCLLKKILI